MCKQQVYTRYVQYIQSAFIGCDKLDESQSAISMQDSFRAVLTVTQASQPYSHQVPDAQSHTAQGIDELEVIWSCSGVTMLTH